jgi:hypothetical protein
MKKDEKFDKMNLMIHFESSFTNKSVGEAFFNFLKTEFNEEPWNFITDVNSIKKQKNKKEKILLIQKIIEKYIKDDSVSEINVSGKTKLEILTAFQIQEGNRRMGNRYTH